MLCQMASPQQARPRQNRAVAGEQDDVERIALAIAKRAWAGSAALEYFRLEWPGYFAVPADAPPVPGTVRVSLRFRGRRPSPRPRCSRTRG
jgi:hypothetical protein